MTINIKLAAIAGVIWGVVALGLSFLVSLVPLLAQIFPQNTISLGSFAVVMAGVHFGARNKDGKLLDDVFGGIIAGVIAGLLMFLINLSTGGGGIKMTSGLNSIGGALVLGVTAGLFGALGMQVVKRVNF
jgi:hypothetical protein